MSNHLQAEPQQQTESQRALILVIGLLSDPPDLSLLADTKAWSLVKQHSKRLGVEPLIAYVVRPQVTGSERAWCDAILTRAWVRHEHNVNHLKFVLGVLSDAGIQTLSLKGPLLARRHYDPPFLRRPSVDLDIAVRERDLELACETLVRCGYEQQGTLQEDLKCSHHVVLLHKTKMSIELHFRLSHGALGIPVNDALFERALPFEIPGGGTALVPGAADEILQLVLHLAKDRFKPIFHLYEIRRLWLAAPLPVLQEVVSRAAENHFLGVIAMMDIAFRTRWGQPFLPPEISLSKTWLHWRINEELYTAFENWTDAEQGLPLKKRLRGRWLELQTTDGPAEALRFFGMMARIAWFRARAGSQIGTHLF